MSTSTSKLGTVVESVVAYCLVVLVAYAILNTTFALRAVRGKSVTVPDGWVGYRIERGEDGRHQLTSGYLRSGKYTVYYPRESLILVECSVRSFDVHYRDLPRRPFSAAVDFGGACDSPDLVGRVLQTKPNETKFDLPMQFDALYGRRVLRVYEETTTLCMDERIGYESPQCVLMVQASAHALTAVLPKVYGLRLLYDAR